MKKLKSNIFNIKIKRIDSKKIKNRFAPICRHQRRYEDTLRIIFAMYMVFDVGDWS